MYSFFHIRNYKSLRNIKIDSPGAFTTFVGPNASGKSNIFEAIDFLYTYSNYNGSDALRLFGGYENILFRKVKDARIIIDVAQSNKQSIIKASIGKDGMTWDIVPLNSSENLVEEPVEKYIVTKTPQLEAERPLHNFSKIFVNNSVVEKIQFKDNQKLSTACGNLENVLKRILQDESKRDELLEWLALFIPGFENIQINTEPLSGSHHLLVYEKGHEKPFTRDLISDGTFNIISLLTAVYQNDEPQFLCIEEPENGLNPKVVRQLVAFFREQCKAKGHFIWLNTHSQTLVSELTPEEIILVDKIDGETRIKQIQGMNLHGLRMDEALHSGVLGGGIPW